jgi:hypothetical protein
MRTNRSSILFVLAIVGFIVLSLTPRGLSLCIGGGHALDEVLAGWCGEYGGHVHAPLGEAHAGCHDHDGHHHHDHHAEPCADIPLGLDDCRPQVTNWQVDLGASMPALPLAQPILLQAIRAPSQELQFRARDHLARLDVPPNAMDGALRAIVLLI